MERQSYDSNGDMNSGIIKAQAIELFHKVKIFIQEKILAEQKILRKPRESHDHFSQVESEGVQQHLISSVIFRLVRRSHGDHWEFENIWDTVNISRLDDIRRTENCKYLLNFENDLNTAMAENINVVLKRTILDWSREDGDVMRMQIVWSGSFQECQRVVELIDNDTQPSIQLRIEQFSLHTQLRRQFIYSHQTNPVVASLAAIYSSPKVIIDKRLLDASDNDGEGVLCVICQDMIPVGFIARQLPCKHLSHAKCIVGWFIRQFKCPLCRDDFNSSPKV